VFLQDIKHDVEENRKLYGSFHLLASIIHFLDFSLRFESKTLHYGCSITLLNASNDLYFSSVANMYTVSGGYKRSSSDSVSRT